MGRLLAELGRPAPGPGSAAVFERWVAADDRVVFVVDGGSGPSAVAAVVFRERLNHERPEAWIPDLYVARDERRRGLARALLEACAAEARRRGCRLLRLECGFGREEAHALYPALGFERRGYDYRLELD